MSTRKQRATNRANAQQSTGPTTQAQPASHYNAAKHGIVGTTQIMFDESADDLAGLAAEYHQQYSPADSTQRFLVDTLVANEWRLRRTRRVEAELWDHATNIFMAANTEVPACSSGDAFATAGPTFERLQRIANSCERAYHRALKELQAKVGQAFSPANPDALPQKPPQPEAEPAPTPAAPPQPEQSKTTSAKLGSFRQNPKTPPAAPSSNSGAASTNPAAAAENPAPASENPPASSNRAPRAPETK
jgi:hypothetical protein